MLQLGWGPHKAWNALRPTGGHCAQWSKPDAVPCHRHRCPDYQTRETGGDWWSLGGWGGATRGEGSFLFNVDGFSFARWKASVRSVMEPRQRERTWCRWAAHRDMLSLCHVGFTAIKTTGREWKVLSDRLFHELKGLLFSNSPWIQEASNTCWLTMERILSQNPSAGHTRVFDQLNAALTDQICLAQTAFFELGVHTLKIRKIYNKNHILSFS